MPFAFGVRALALAVAVAPAGCKLGPDHPPDTPLPATAWSQPGSPGISPDEASLEDWWTRFNDPTLISLIARAEASNQSLAEALANVRASFAQLGVTESELWPDIGAGASYERRRVNFSQLAAEGVELDPFDVYAYGAAMSGWEIDLWGKVRRQIEAARATVDAQVDLLRQTLVSVRAQLATNYMQVRTLQGRIEVVRQSAANLRRIRDVVAQRVEAGTATALDLARAQAQLDLVEAQIPALESARVAAVNSIALLCGAAPGDVSAQLDAPAPIPDGPATIGVGIPADLLRRRADVRASEQQLVAATALIGAAEALYLPALTISGNFYISATSMSGLSDWDNRAYGFGPSLAVPLFTGGYIESVVEQQKAQADAALAAYRNTVLAAISDVETAIASLVQSRESEQRYRLAYQSALQALSLAQQQFDAGVTDITTLLDVENQVLEAQDDYVQSQGLVAQDIVGLYRALGGGWEGSAVSYEGEKAGHVPMKGEGS